VVVGEQAGAGLDVFLCACLFATLISPFCLFSSSCTVLYSLLLLIFIYYLLICSNILVRGGDGGWKS